MGYIENEDYTVMNVRGDSVSILAVRRGSIKIHNYVSERIMMDNNVVEYTALIRYLLSEKSLDVLNFSFSLPPSMVIWYLESYVSPESRVDTVNSSLEPLSRGSGSEV